jgi:hypothetical protein
MNNTSDLLELCDRAIQLWDADCDMESVISEMRTVLDQSKFKDHLGEEKPKFLEENLAAFNPFRYPKFPRV